MHTLSVDIESIASICLRGKAYVNTSQYKTAAREAAVLRVTPGWRIRLLAVEEAGEEVPDVLKDDDERGSDRVRCRSARRTDHKDAFTGGEDRGGGRVALDGGRTIESDVDRAGRPAPRLDRVQGERRT